MGIYMSVDVATFCSNLVFETSVSTGFGRCLVAKSLCDAVVCLFFLSVDLTMRLRTAQLYGRAPITTTAVRECQWSLLLLLLQ